MVHPGRNKILRISAVVSSVLLVGAYVSCRAVGDWQKHEAAAVTPQEPAAGEVTPVDSPELFPGSKSAEVFTPAPAQQPPPPRQQRVMPGSKSAPILNPR